MLTNFEWYDLTAVVGLCVLLYLTIGLWWLGEERLAFLSTRKLVVGVVLWPVDMLRTALKGKNHE